MVKTVKCRTCGLAVRVNDATPTLRLTDFNVRCAYIKGPKPSNFEAFPEKCPYLHGTLDKADARMELLQTT